LVLQQLVLQIHKQENPFMRFGRIPYFYSNSIVCAAASAADSDASTKRLNEGRNSKFLRPRIVAAGVLAALLFSGSATFAASGPFAEMAGVWSGSGTISLDSGASERIRCRATYAVSGDGTGLNQNLVCASDSYKFELKSDVLAKDGSLSGTWSELSRNVGGSLEGRASNGQFDVVVSAVAFKAKLSVTTHGNKQAVSINSEGAIKGASISLSRA
jgi:hypothetical protein